MLALEPLLAKNDRSLPGRAKRAWLLMGGRAALGAKSPGQGPADLGPSGSLQRLSEPRS